MSDRELLELAAEAAGYVLGNDTHQLYWYEYGENSWGLQKNNCNGTSTRWNPLVDDGDALRLAVKLGMLIDVRYGAGDHKNIRITYWINPMQASYIEESGEAYLSTRRAIVRAAAAVGESQ